MSKHAIGIAVLVLATLLSGAAIGKGGGGHGGGHGGRGGGHGHGHAHFGGAHHGGGGFARSHASRGGFASNHAIARHGGQKFGQMRNAQLGSRNVRNALNSLSHSGGLRSGRLLASPVARAQIAAAAALAGWHGGAAAGWWRHAGGGYGWVGPLFWPFAYNDIYDYTIWGDGIGFWGYGYPDIYAGLFAPYGYNELAGYLPQRPSGRRHGGSPQLGQMCGSDSRTIAGLPIDQIAEAVQPNEAQGAVLDELGNASIAAAQNIRAACPTQVVLTAPGRLAAMQQRIVAMATAVTTVQPPLEKFYGLLNDEQKARLNALAEDQRKVSAANNGQALPAQGCGAAQVAAVEWPAGEIEARLHPDEAQRAKLGALRNTSAEAAEMLKAACRADDAMTPPARLAAISNRLNTMLQAVKQVRAALEDFYVTLSDEQKAQFEAIGPRRRA